MLAGSVDLDTAGGIVAGVLESNGSGPVRALRKLIGKKCKGLSDTEYGRALQFLTEGQIRALILELDTGIDEAPLLTGVDEGETHDDDTT